jgi:hypothetical protein
MRQVNTPIKTDQYVRGNRGLGVKHVLGILALIGAIAVTVIAIAGRDATTPTMIVLVGVLVAVLWWRQRVHQSEVIDAIAKQHGVQVPHSALFALMRGNEPTFVHDGTRYRLTSTGDPTHGNNEPAKIVLTRFDSDPTHP